MAHMVNGSNDRSFYTSRGCFTRLGLDRMLLEGIYQMKFDRPSKFQEIVLPYLLNNPPRNIIAQSQSGTGKNVAFSIAIISRIRPTDRSPRALIIVPSYELAIQTGSLIEKIAEFLPHIKVAYAVRGRTIADQIDPVSGRGLTQTIVIGTPGTLEEWCYKLRVIDLNELRICCIDEADLMLLAKDFGRIIFAFLQNLKNSNCQTMFFSTTYSSECISCVDKLIQQPIVLRVKRQELVLPHIKQFYVFCDVSEDRYNTIAAIFQSMIVGQTIIFCGKIETAHDLARQMLREAYSVRVLTSALDIYERQTVMRQFCQGIIGVLISVNIATRGIDVPEATLIINYDIPETDEPGVPDYNTYLHRIGRCGRFGRKGFVFNLIDSLYDRLLLKLIEAHFSCSIRRITPDKIPNFRWDEI